MHSFTCCHMVVAFDCRLFIVVLIILYLASMHYCLLLASGWSHLHYVNVEIEGLPAEVIALDDSGAQLCCVRADVIATLALPKLGHTKLRGITDETVMADLVSLRIRMSGGQVFVPVTCAACDKLNSPLILGSDVVDRLHTRMLKEHYSPSAAVSNTPDVDCQAGDTVDVRLISDDDVIDDEVVDDSDSVANTDNVIDADADTARDNSDVNDRNTSSVDALVAEQKNDKSLAVCWNLAGI